MAHLTGTKGFLCKSRHRKIRSRSFPIPSSAYSSEFTRISSVTDCVSEPVLSTWLSGIVSANEKCQIKYSTKPSKTHYSANEQRIFEPRSGHILTALQLLYQLVSHPICIHIHIHDPIIHGPILKPPREYLVRGTANPKITCTKVVGFVGGHRMVTFNSTLNLTF